jgi:transposase-like protein
MPEQRGRFSPRFKAEAVQRVLETGKPIAEVARDLTADHRAKAGQTGGSPASTTRDRDPDIVPST